MSELVDREMEQAIRRFLINDPRVDISEIDLKVQDAVAYLSGVVDSAAERHAIQEDIRAAAAVENIIDQLRLKNYVERTDEELKEEVRHALARDISVDEEQIDVEAKQGMVVLSGQVHSYAQKSAAEDVAWWTPGVTEVASQLAVEEEGELPEDLSE